MPAEAAPTATDAASRASRNCWIMEPGDQRRLGGGAVGRLERDGGGRGARLLHRLLLRRLGQAQLGQVCLLERLALLREPRARRLGLTPLPRLRCAPLRRHLLTQLLLDALALARRRRERCLCLLRSHLALALRRGLGVCERLLLERLALLWREAGGGGK